jgi:hypothetical protein
MEFTPFKSVPQVINFVEKPNTQLVKDQIYIHKPKNIKTFPKSKYCFIEKYKLVELNSPSNESSNSSFYYDQKSQTVYEIDNSGPVVFMKTTGDITSQLLKLNGI